MTFCPQAHLNITDPAAILRVAVHRCHRDSRGIIQMNHEPIVMIVISETDGIISR